MGKWSLETKPRIVIADDETLIRDCLAIVLAQEMGVEIAGLARDGEEALRLVHETAPDLVLLDLHMPRMDGLTAAREIRKLRPATKIAIFTDDADRETIFAAIESGADAYLLKTSGREEIVAALRDVIAGQKQVSGPALRIVIDEFRRLRQAEIQLQELPATVSARENDVLRLVCRGLSNKETANELGLAVSTVKSHLHSAFKKLGVEDRTEAALLVANQGWFRTD